VNRWRRLWRELRGWPVDGWLRLPTGDTLPLTPVYVGRDERGLRMWDLYLDGPESVVVPLAGLQFGMDVLPGRSAVRVHWTEVDDRHVKITSYEARQR
jgi:hypothetical protein